MQYIFLKVKKKEVELFFSSKFPARFSISFFLRIQRHINDLMREQEEKIAVMQFTKIVHEMSGVYQKENPKKIFSIIYKREQLLIEIYLSMRRITQNWIPSQTQFIITF